jgi:hypothetical protein
MDKQKLVAACLTDVSSYINHRISLGLPSRDVWNQVKL